MEIDLSIGSRFDPTGLELVRDYLRSKVERGHNSFITDMDVFEDEPWLLPHVKPHPLSMEREWFYFVPMTQGGDKKAKRTVSGGGMWRSLDRTNRKTKILDGNNGVIGYKQSFVYYKKVKGNPKGIITDWWMKEYSLSDDQLQDWVLCKIRHKPQDKNSNDIKDDEEEKEEEEESGLLGLADEFDKLVLDEDGDVTRQQQETPIPLPQAQHFGFETMQNNEHEFWDDLMSEQLQMLPMVLTAQDSEESADQDTVGGDMMMNDTSYGLVLVVKSKNFDEGKLMENREFSKS